MNNCSGECWECQNGTIGCLSGGSDDDFTPASISEIVNRIDNHKFPAREDEMISALRKYYRYDYITKQNLWHGNTVDRVIHGLIKYMRTTNPTARHVKIGNTDITRLITSSGMNVYIYKFRSNINIDITEYPPYQCFISDPDMKGFLRIILSNYGFPDKRSGVWVMGNDTGQIDFDAPWVDESPEKIPGEYTFASVYDIRKCYVARRFVSLNDMKEIEYMALAI